MAVAEWQSGFVETNGVRLHYTRTGGGKPPLVLAHGVTDSGLCWSPVARALAADYDVVMVDARGHGQSDAPETGYGPLDQAADLQGLIQALGLRRPAVLGHSMGALTALLLAAAYPEVPGVIVLEDPPPFWLSIGPRDPGDDGLEGMRAWAAGVKQKTREELIALQRAEAPGWPEEEIEPWADSKIQFSLRVFSGFAPQELARIHWFPLLRRVACPALLITADLERGGACSPGAASALQSLLPGLRVSHIAGAGHSIRRDQRERYLVVVRSFLVAPPAGPIISPEVHPDGRVTVRLSAPYATDTRLGGAWQLPGAEAAPMRQGDDGVWAATVGPLAPDLYEYTLVLDGLRILDPLNREVSVNPGSPRNLAFVPGPESDFMALRPVPHGGVATVWYHSELLGAGRRMHVYTPPGYGASGDSYPVLYLLHGGGGLDSDWAVQGRAGLILDNLLAAGCIRPMIVVMPDCNVGRTRPGADPLARELLDTIIPLVERSYRVVAERSGRWLAGLSMGGLQALNVGLYCPEMFGSLGVMSSGWFSDMLQEVEADLGFLEGVRRAPFDRVWVACGRQDTLALQNTAATLQFLTRVGIPTIYHETDGGHDWARWRGYLAVLAPLLAVPQTERR